jgi:hypothetical protein
MARKLKQHGIAYTTGVAREAAEGVTDFLITTWPQTVAVHNVEEIPEYQAHDIDLLWTVVERRGRMRVIPIEIKGDRYHQTGNFFFETISNESKGTPGCFLYTQARWLFYYFTEIGRLYCLPMSAVQPWFIHHMERFEERRTSTPVGGETYVTVGRLVPIQTLLEEVGGILIFQKKSDGWHRLHPE